MKSTLFPALAALALCVCPSHADPSDRAASPNLEASEKALLLEKTSRLLHRSVRFDTDDLATSHYLRTGNLITVEWRHLVFRQLILGTVSENDRERGVERRIYAQLWSESYRLFTADGIITWLSGRCPGLRVFVMNEEIHGIRDERSVCCGFREDPSYPATPEVDVEQLMASNF